MANLNIKFNNKSYSIDPASLADATARLEAHLASMVGGGDVDSNIITWDGNMDGREVVNLGVVHEFLEACFLVHVSDRVLVKEDCIGGCATLTSSTGNNVILPIDDIVSEKDGAIWFAHLDNDPAPSILSTSSVIVDFLGMGEITLPSTGTYFMYAPYTINGVPTGEVRYISKLELPSTPDAAL